MIRCFWKNSDHTILVFQNGLLVNIVIDLESGRIEQIVFDKFLMKNLQNEYFFDGNFFLEMIQFDTKYRIAKRVSNFKFKKSFALTLNTYSIIPREPSHMYKQQQSHYNRTFYEKLVINISRYQN